MIVEQHYDDEALIALLRDAKAPAPHAARCDDCAGELKSYRDLTGALRDNSIWDDREIDEEPRPATASKLRSFAAAAKAEDAAAGPIVARLLEATPTHRRDLLAAHPEWRTAGVVRKLLEAVDKSNFVDPKAAAEWAELAVDVAESIDATPYPFDSITKLRAAAWRERAYALYYVGSFADSLVALDRTDALLSQCAVSEYDGARARLVRAIVCRSYDRFDEAASLARQSKVAFVAFGDRRRAAIAENVEAAVLVSLRRFPEALAVNLRIATDETLDAESRAWGLSNAAFCHRELSQFEEAKKLYARAILADEKLGRLSGLAKSRWGLARLLLDQGYHEAALALLAKVRSEFDELGMAHDLAVASLDSADALLALDRVGEVSELCRASIEYFRKAGLAYGESAMTALAYLREVAERKTITPATIRTVRTFIEVLPKQPHLLFAYPA